MFQNQAHKKYKDKTLNNTKPPPDTIKPNTGKRGALQGTDRSLKVDCSKHIQSLVGRQSFKKPATWAQSYQVKTLRSPGKVTSSSAILQLEMEAMLKERFQY